MLTTCCGRSSAVAAGEAIFGPGLARRALQVSEHAAGAQLRRADSSRTRGARIDRIGAVQSSDRSQARVVHQHDQQPHLKHLRQAPGRQPGRGDRTGAVSRTRRLDAEPRGCHRAGGLGSYRQVVPVRTVRSRWAPSSGWASVMRRMASRMRAVTALRARSAAVLASMRGLPSGRVARRSSARSCSRSSVARCWRARSEWAWAVASSSSSSARRRRYASSAVRSTTASARPGVRGGRPHRRRG